MEHGKIERVQGLCKPLGKHKHVMAAWIYGSAVKVKKPHDIDVLVLLDDTGGLKEKDVVEIEGDMKHIRESAKKEKLNLHFQPPKFLTRWWALIQKGEPWVITSLKNFQTIYDETGYLTLISGLIKKGIIYHRDEKAERLATRANRYYFDNRDLMLEALEELYMAIVEGAQIFLMFNSKMAFGPDRIIREMTKMKINTGTFVEMADLADKARKGVLSEFSGANLDYYSGKVNLFIDRLEDMLLEKIKSKKESAG